MKHQLAAEGRTGRDYAYAKSELIQQMVDRARSAGGLPSVPGWEE